MELRRHPRTVFEPISLPNFPLLQGVERKVKSWNFSVVPEHREIHINCMVDYYLPGTNTLAQVPGLGEYKVSLLATNDWVYKDGPKAGTRWSQAEIDTHLSLEEYLTNYPTKYAEWQVRHQSWSNLPAPQKAITPEPIEPNEPVEPTMLPMEEFDFFTQIVGVNVGLKVNYNSTTNVAEFPLIKQTIQSKAIEQGNKFDRKN